MAKKTIAASEEVIVQAQQLCVCVEVEGTSDLVQNKFAQKSVEQMLRKHMGLPVEKEKKVPAECVARATVKNTAGNVSIPPEAFKLAMVSAAAQVKGLTKTGLRTGIFVEGCSVPITYSRMRPGMDVVRTSGIGRTPDIRFRPYFEDWKARFIVDFADIYPVQTVVDLINRAGTVGVQEWRPEKNGTKGTFVVSRMINDPREIAEVRRLCRPPIEPLVIPDWAMNVELTPEILKRVAHGIDEGETADEE